MKVDIAYLVSHGFAARMVMQTNLLGKLKDQGLEVAVVCPDEKDPVLAQYCADHGIQINAFHATSILNHPKYLLYRTYFLEDLSSNAALFEKHYFELHYNTLSSVFHKIIIYILWFFHPFIRFSKVIPKLFTLCETFLLNQTTASTVLDRLHPNLVVSTYPVNGNEGIILHHARKRKIKTVIHLLSWDNISCKGHFYSLADYYLAWGPIMNQEFQQYYSIPESQIFNCGVCHFDIHQMMLDKAFPNYSPSHELVNASEPYLFFGMSSPRFVPNEIEIVEYLAQKVNENAFGQTMRLIIRPHPQNISGSMADQSWLSRLQKIQNNRVQLFYPLTVSSGLPWSIEKDDMILLSSVLYKAVVCINSCSTLSIDALMLEKGNIAPMFDGNDLTRPYWNSAKRLLKYTHIQTFVKHGGTHVVHNFHELDVAIQQFITNPDYLLPQRSYCRLQETGNQKGDATEKVIRELISFLGG